MFSSNLKLKINPLMDKKIHGSSSGRDFRGSTISSVKCSLNNSEDLIVKVRERVKGKVEISPSAYDTAWVAMVPAREYSGGKPRFPECLDWIVENQNSDGSWGVQSPSMLKNTLSCTLACLLPLRKWNVASPQLLRKWNVASPQLLRKWNVASPQVFYCSYPSSNRSKSDWWAVCKTQACSIVQVPPQMTESSIPPPSQQDELVMVDSIVADEQIPNLSDGVVIEIVEDDDEEDEDEEFEFSDDSSSSHSDEEDI